jgi:alpha-1,6-mannosyltransferase
MIGESYAASSQASRPFEGSTGSVRADRMPMLALGGLLACGLIVALSVARTPELLPGSIRYALPSYLAGAFPGLGVDLGVAGLAAVMAAMGVCYALAVYSADRLPVWAVLMAIAALNMLVLLAPPILSTDVFSYLAYGRLGALYHVNPYLHGPNWIQDPLNSFVGHNWITTPTVYGPLFTFLGYILAPLDVAASLMAYKLLAAVSSLIVVVLVWSSAGLRGVNQVRAIALVGLNPVTIFYGIGGGHNDLLMLALVMGAVYLLLRQRETASGALIVAAAAVKLTGGLLLPFALARRRGRRYGGRPMTRVLAGSVAAGVLIAVPSLFLFGPSVLHLFTTLQRIQGNGASHSIPGWILTHVGLQSWIGPAGLVLDIAFGVCVVWLALWVWLGRLDWITGAGWATVAMLLTAGFLLPWYVAWLIPLAGLSRDRRLLIASAALTGICLTTL